MQRLHAIQGKSRRHAPQASGGVLRYYVVFPDGQRFGPADLQTLQLWVAENRVGPATVLEEEGTGRSMPAYALPSLGLSLSQSGPQPGPPSSQPYAGYYRPDLYQVQQGPGLETRWAWVLGAIGLLCGQLASIGGIVLAIIGLTKRQRGATAALVFCAATFILHTVWGLALGSILRF